MGFIGNITKKQIREAYFKRKVPALLAKVQEQENITEEDLEKLKNYLSTLRKTEGGLLDTIKEYLPEYEEDETLKEVSTQEIRKPDDMDAVLKSMNLAEKTLKKTANSYIRNDLDNPTNDELLDTAFVLVGLLSYIDEGRLYYKQLYKKKITEFEVSGKQRKTAEEYAMVTSEYRNYKKLLDLKMRADEFINLAKKKYSTLNY
jgi:hypothetical protein